MSAKEIKISIKSALDAAGIEATKSQVSALAKSVSDSMKGMAENNRTHWADVKAVWDMGSSAIKTLWSNAISGIVSAFNFETTTTQFATLIGNIDDATAHMADLKALGDTPPFSLDEFAKASRSLMVMTDGALGYKASLELIGDAAAATGQPLESVGHAVGRLYATIRDGQPLSRATAELRNMGILTPELVAELDELQDAGASNADIWAKVEERLGTYKGAMRETEATGNGLMGAIKTRWDNIVRAFGQTMATHTKGGMVAVLDAAKELEESGTLEVWASKVGTAIGKAVEALKTAIGWAGKLVDAFRFIQDSAAASGAAIGAFVGTLSAGGSFRDAASAFREHGINEMLERIDTRAEEQVAEANARAEARQRRERAAQQRAQERVEAERTRIAEDLVNHETKNRERRAAKEEDPNRAFLKEDLKEIRRQKEMVEARDEVRELDEKIEALQGRIEEAEREGARNKRGRAADARHKNGTFGPYDYNARSGGDDNFIDWQRADRFAGWGDRDAQKAARRDAASQKKYDNLKDNENSGKTLSDRDRKFMDDWEKYQDARNGAKNLKAEKDRAEKERNDMVKEMKQSLSNIEKNIKDALGVA